MLFKTQLSCLLLFLLSLSITAQITEYQLQKVDSLFLPWNAPNHPGGAISIMKNGEIIYSKAFGLASLEYEIKNKPETIFNTGSVSKQFTAMGIVLLHLQGKLSVDDDIRKHLPELPDFGESITIRHMLHHTSGLRSLHALLGLAGWRSDDSRTNDDLNRFMQKQKELNFKPGEEFLYCNTGYMLMVNIIERITKEKFPSWLKENIFEPLNMKNTYVENKYSRVVVNNATSYHKSDSSFERAVEYWGYIGSGNMHSTTTDLLLWLQNFYKPQSGWEKAFLMMQTLDKLNNGDDNDYAYGVKLDEYLGHERVQHGGSIGGFKASIGVYPEKKLGVAILTNFSNANPGGKANQIANILLKDLDLPLENAQIKTTDKFINLSTNQLDEFEGNFWNPKEFYARKIYLRNDTLRYFRSKNNESALLPISNNEFRMSGVSVEVIVKFVSNNSGKKIMEVIINDAPPIKSEFFEPSTPTQEELTSYTGNFFSPELETSYRIYLEGNQLKWHHARHGDYDMKILKKDVLEGNWPFSIITISRDQKGNTNGIFVSNGRVRNLWFEKAD